MHKNVHQREQAWHGAENGRKISHCESAQGCEVTKTVKADDVKDFDNVVISYKEVLSISVVTPVPAAKSKP